MSEVEANKALGQRMFDAINKGDLAVFDQLVADDFVEHEEFPGIPPTKEGVRQLFTMLGAAFADLRFHAEDMIAEGDKLVIRARLAGRHQGEFMGIAATGKQVDVPFADVFRIANGKVVEHWASWTRA